MLDDQQFVDRKVQAAEAKIAARGVNVHYGDTHAIKDVDVDIDHKTVTAFIGPSGWGNPRSCVASTG